jgi:hypothetical protein
MQKSRIRQPWEYSKKELIEIADWWYAKGKYDVKDFSTPQFPSIVPYIRGWNDETLRQNRSIDNRD